MLFFSSKPCTPSRQRRLSCCFGFIERHKPAVSSP
jgi:hypothetical protein